jgi:hypothetical protein
MNILINLILYKMGASNEKRCKMSNFEKLEESLCKKFILLGCRVKFQKNHSNVVSIIFYFFLKNNLENTFLLPNIYSLGNE